MNCFILSLKTSSLEIISLLLKILKIGSQITGVGTAGANFNEYMAALKMRENENSDWKYLDSENNAGGFVCLDMKNGVNGYDRALW